MTTRKGPLRGKLITTDEAVPAKGQHKRPCSDCPWARAALPGWLGEMSREAWLAEAHGESVIDCHTQIGAQCAGAAIYRANVCKSVRHPHALTLAPDPARVFASPKEFTEHHDISRLKRA